MFYYLLNGLPYFSGSVGISTGLFGNGTAAAPSISFLSDPDTGWWKDAVPNTIAGSFNGTQSIRIGQTDVGGFYLRSTGSGAQLEMNGAGKITLIAAGTNQNITLTPSGAGRVSVNETNTLSGSIVAHFGAVGGQFVSVGDNVGSNGLLYVGASTTNVFLNSRNNHPIDFLANNSQAMRLFANGRLAVGTTTDSGALLQVGTDTTTSAGGQIFGTDTFIFRNNTRMLAVQGVGGSDVYFRVFQSGGTSGVGLASSAGAAFLDTFVVGQSLTIRTSNQQTALTIDSSQRTILAGALRLSMAYTAGVGAATGYLTVQDSGGTTYKIPVLV